MDADDDEDALEQLYSRIRDFARQQPMSPRERKIRTNPSREDLSRRRRNRRTAGGDMTNRADLMRAVQKAASQADQAHALDALRAYDDHQRRTAAQNRELDFASDVVAQTMAPVRVHEMHTASTDWLGYDLDVPGDFIHRANAEAAAWFSRTSSLVRQDAEEFGIQAEGKARQISGQFGPHAQQAAESFLAYAQFLRRQAASGLDQIQQTTAPDGVTNKPTPMPEDVFDNFAPPVHPINEGVTGTESSENNALIQTIMGGGSGMDSGAPEKPIEHDTSDSLSWAPPSGMQADTAPGWGDGDPGTPEKGGDRPQYTASARYGQPSVAIGGYGYTLDDFRREAAAKASRGNDRGGRTAAASDGCCEDCGPGCKGDCCSKCTMGGSKTAASGLDQIDQTIDPNNVPKPTPYPGEVAFPLNDEFQDEPTTNGTGDVQTFRPAQARKVQADMFGNSDAPHAVPGGPVANSPATTPPAPYGAESAGKSDGRGAASSDQRPAYADGSSSVPGFVNGVGEGYEEQMAAIMHGQPLDTPGSMVGMPSATTHAGSVSSLITTASEREDKDFRKGYGYASRWQPGTPLVSLGSASFEAGVYAGISDNAAHQRAFVAAHRQGAHQDLTGRAAKHSALTHRIASKNDQPTNGLYLTAATSIELNTTAPNTTPAADGSTPINGRGNPGPLDGLQDAAAPGGASPYNGAPPYGSPVVPGGNQAEPNPADALTGGGGMSTPAQVQAAFRKRVQANLLAQRQGK